MELFFDSLEECEIEYKKHFIKYDSCNPTVWEFIYDELEWVRLPNY